MSRRSGGVVSRAPSCRGAEAVPQEGQSVIIILMTRIAMLAMSSHVCAKANGLRPNCKIN